MKRILVPTDFSPNADKALDYAVHIARQLQGALFIIHAVEIPDTPLNTPHSDSSQKIIASINEQLDLIRKSISESELINVTTKLYTNSFIPSLSNAIHDFNAELIIMGTIGSSGIQEKLFGSKTAFIIGKSPIPLLAIPLLSNWTIPNKILIALNETMTEMETLRPAFKLASSFLSSVQVAIFTDTDDDAIEDLKTNKQKILSIREQLKKSYPTTDINPVHLGGKHFQESINKWIDEENIDILVMLTHKRTFLESLFNWSKTKKMSYQINIPLLAIPFTKK